MGSGALHKDILLDNVRDAQANPAAGNWACQLILRAQSLGMSAPFDASGSVVIDAAQHRDQALQRVQRGWDDTHISPRSCPSAGAKLYTYHRWFSRPNPQVTEPYFELPLSRRSLGPHQQSQTAPNIQVPHGCPPPPDSDGPPSAAASVHACLPHVSLRRTL